MELHANNNLILLSKEQLKALINEAVEAARLEFTTSKNLSVSDIDYISIKEALKIIGISRPTLNKLIKEKIVRSYRPGGIRRIFFVEEELKEDLKNYSN
jgi:excisionase family DNA binding protein